MHLYTCAQFCLFIIHQYTGKNPLFLPHFNKAMMTLNPTKNTAIPRLKPPYCVSDSWVHNNTVSQVTLGQHFVQLCILPFLHLLPVLSHMHWEQRRRWWQSHLQSSESISFFQISALQHQTFCNINKKNELLKFILPFQNFFSHYYYSLSKMIYWNSQQDICNHEQLVLHWCTTLSRTFGQKN